MAQRLNKRTTAAPKKAKEAPEPETVLEKGPESAVVGKVVPMHGMCDNCGVYAAHSESDRLCYNCHKETEGFTFDEDTKRWVKKTKKEKK